MHARNVIAFFVWAWPSGFVTKAVSLGELLHEEALLVLPGGNTPRTLIPVWTLPLRHISSSLSVARPFQFNFLLQVDRPTQFLALNT